VLLSYSDLNQGHEGKIYQASNWIFVGMTGHEAGIMLNGKLTHRRTINSKYGTSDILWLRKRIDPNATRYEGKPKFKYLFRLDDEIALSKHYPKTRDTPGVHPGKAPGSTDRGAPTASHRIESMEKRFNYALTFQIRRAPMG
jgi:hypothetical protein